ncbi:MAG: hypothetical protein HYR51_18340 [Candidatus Rokubacteria bacterium]|nr:hypothetical protein [Candidatus Rokubacteria bacterium]
MHEVTPEAVRTMAEAAGLPLSADDAAEVTHRINAFLHALGPLAALSLERVRPLPLDPEHR